MSQRDIESMYYPIEETRVTLLEEDEDGRYVLTVTYTLFKVPTLSLFVLREIVMKNNDKYTERIDTYTTYESALIDLNENVDAFKDYYADNPPLITHRRFVPMTHHIPSPQPSLPRNSIEERRVRRRSR